MPIGSSLHGVPRG